MATSSSSKRPVVLSLGELERYPTVYDRYEMTLPFYNKVLRPWDNPLQCSCRRTNNGWDSPRYSWGLPNWFELKCEGCDTSISFAKVKAMAVRQTEKRWNWFSEARKLDDKLGRRLGTLGYLPLEIREKIWHAAMEGCVSTDFSGCYLRNMSWDVLSLDNSWDVLPLHWLQSNRSHQVFLNMTQSSRSHPTMGTPYSELCLDDMFDFPLDAPSKRPWGNHGLMQLRHASPDLKIELDNVIVFASIFRFSCPVILWRFLNSSSAQQINSLRSMTIELSSCSRCCDYRPLHLKSCFEAWIAIVEHLPATLQSLNLELDFEVLQLLNNDMSSPFLKNDKVMAQVEIIVNKIRRQTPNATISTGGLWRRDDSKVFQDMVDELDDYSEDYKNWWRESREEAMSQSEET